MEHKDKRNKIPYLYKEEELHDFFSSQAISIKEYIQVLRADEEKDRIFEKESNEV